MGLLDDDSEIDRVMEEAESVRFGTQLRCVFVTVLLFIRPSNPPAFWESHKLTLCKDLMQRDGVVHLTEEVVHEVLLDIQEYLERGGFSLTDFHLPTPDPALLHNRASREMHEETGYNIGTLQQVLSHNLDKLNDDQ